MEHAKSIAHGVDLDRDDYRLIPLSQGLFARVSPEDYARVSHFKWYASKESRGTKYYAIRRIQLRPNGKRFKIRMHRFILDLGTGFDDPRVVDHLNHDPLDNRRENLEIITQEENMRRSNGWKKKDEPCL